jgi:hypothetical protein
MPMLPRALCPYCGRQVPLVTQRQGLNGTVTLYRYHPQVPGGTVSCRGSRAPLEATTFMRKRPVGFWSGPRTWEDADYPAG